MKRRYYGDIELPPRQRWRKSDVAGFAKGLAFLFGPWLVIAAVILGFLWAIGVWHP